MESFATLHTNEGLFGPMAFRVPAKVFNATECSMTGGAGKLLDAAGVVAHPG
jgi:hypothetical protein